MFILKEDEWAQEMIKSNEIGQHPSTTLRCIARHYIDLGYSKRDVERRMENFIIRCNSDASIPKWSNCINSAICKAYKTPAVSIDYISITKPEMQKIDSLKNKQAKRLAFTMLCLAKYNMIINPEYDYWISYSDNIIMSLANISTSIKYQSKTYRMLEEAKMVQFSKKVDSISSKILFAENGDDILHITDFRNLGYQYLMYHGEPYFECANCGITTKYKNPSRTGGQKYCTSCAAEIHIRQTINSIMRQRDNKLKMFAK